MDQIGFGPPLVDQVVQLFRIHQFLVGWGRGGVRDLDLALTSYQEQASGHSEGNSSPFLR